jgi:hypothetical protein
MMRVADGGQGGGRHSKRAAAVAAAVAQSGGGSAGGGCRNRTAQQAAVAGSGRPLQAAVARTRAAVAGGRHGNNALGQDAPTFRKKAAAITAAVTESGRPL